MGRNGRPPKARPPEHSSQPGPGLVACITILPPWSHLIVTPTAELPAEVQPQKLVENRIWSTSHRGKLVIQAGKNRRLCTPEIERLLPDMVFGAAVGIVDLVACFDRRITAGLPREYAWVEEHRWAERDSCNWVFANVRRFRYPVPLRGQQGMFYVPLELFRQADEDPVREPVLAGAGQRQIDWEA